VNPWWTARNVALFGRLGRLWQERLGTWVLAVLALTLGGRLLLAAQVGVAPDEAYYWGWSLQPAWVYPDHPPAVAWLLAPVASLAAGDALWLRFPALLSGGIVLPLLLWFLAREAGISPGRAWWLPLAMVVQPLGWAAGLFVTPDVPLLLAWTGASLFFLRALRLDEWWSWALAGILVGGALLSKHSGWILLASLGLTLLVESRPWPRRRWLKIGVALALCCVVVAPHLWADGQGGFASLRFQLNHGLGPSNLAWAPVRLLEFVGGQVGLLTPLVAAGAGWFLWHGRYAPVQERRLWYLAWPPLAVFAGAALLAHPEANWPAPAHPLLLVGMVASWDRRHPVGQDISRGRRFLPLIAAALSLLLTAAALTHLLRPLPFFPPSLEPAARLRGWRELPTWLSGSTLYALDYELAAALRFHLPGRPVVRNHCPRYAGHPEHVDHTERAGQGEDTDSDVALLVLASPGTEPPTPDAARCDPGPHRCWQAGPWAPLRRADGEVVRTIASFRSLPCDDLPVAANRFGPGRQGNDAVR
jgi:hypothetical protein